MRDPDLITQLLDIYGDKKTLELFRRGLRDMLVCLDHYEEVMYPVSEEEDTLKTLDGNLLMMIEFAHMKTLMDLVFTILCRNDHRARDIVIGTMFGDETMAKNYVRKQEGVSDSV